MENMKKEIKRLLNECLEREEQLTHQNYSLMSESDYSRFAGYGECLAEIINELKEILLNENIWHLVADGDVPTDNRQVLCCCENGNYEVCRVTQKAKSNVVKWCELPDNN